jgi:hypothetical protein
MFEVVSAFLAVVLLGSIAFPHVLDKLKKDPTKKVGSSYWGVYDGTPTHDLQNHHLNAPKPSKSVKVVAGSAMYAGRR